MSSSWLILSLAVVVMWGAWAFLVKLASQHLSWQEIFILSNLVFFLFTLGLLLYVKPSFAGASQAVFYVLLAGTIGSLGTISFYTALSLGKASIIVPLTALYPVVTVILSVLFLHETLTVKQALGVALAIAAILLISQ
ncbi:hypothetical protein DRO53_03885 [Candidatus Bathyarchaeota archaeon]|nr:MAG: hypothetical protein DRO53_03885 [Candidatus Bathyarchaeota archaeon]